jgi:hypothetical protein
VSPEEFFLADDSADIPATDHSGPAVTLSLLTTLQQNKKQRSATHTHMKATKRAADAEAGLTEPKKKAMKVCTETVTDPSTCAVYCANIVVSCPMITTRHAVGRCGCDEV